MVENMTTNINREVFHVVFLVFPIVRAAPLPSAPAGYMDICMSTRWQEISTLLLASMYLNGFNNLRD